MYLSQNEQPNLFLSFPFWLHVEMFIAPESLLKLQEKLDT